MTTDPASWQRRAAEQLQDAGADLVAGHSAHVFHGAGWGRRGPLLFDLGDALDDYAVDRRVRNDLGLMALWRPGDPQAELELIGLTLDFCHTRLAEAEDAEWIAHAADRGMRAARHSRRAAWRAALSRRSAGSPARVTGRCGGSLATMIELSTQGLGLRDVVAVARQDAEVALTGGARQAMADGAAIVQRLADSDEAVYGVSTGFGSLATTSIPAERRAELQRALLRSHAAGMGPPVEREVVRAMMLLRARTLAMGYSGARPEVAEAILADC